MRKARGRHKWTRWEIVGTVVFSLWVLTPFYFLVITSLSPHGSPPLGFTAPLAFTLNSYHAILNGLAGQPEIWPYLLNSVIIAGGGTLLSFVVSLPAAYGLSRLMPSRLARAAYLSFFVLVALPTLALVLAIFLIYTQLGFMDSRFWLIVALLSTSVPLQVWVLKSFFDAVPKEYEEAAAIDGAGTVGIFVRVVLPLMGEAIAATGILTFLALYVDFLFAVVLTRVSAVTVPVYVVGFENDLAVNVTATSAAAIISMIPMLGVFLIAMRYMKRVAIIGV